MADSPGGTHPISDQHLQESASEVLPIVSLAVSAAGAAGGLGGLYYQRKSYLEQHREREESAAPDVGDSYDPGFAGTPDYDPGFGAGPDYAPGFDGSTPLGPGFADLDEYQPGFEDAEF